MVRKKVKIVNHAGMHTRPASIIVKLAAKHKSDFYIIKDGYRINGKSIIGIMSLAAEYGSELILEFEGSDEQKAAEELTKYFEEGFGELQGED
jgi:phosphocarrier protein HPr